VLQAQVDRQQFARLLHNLMRNAEQAMRHGGSVRVRLRAASEAANITPLGVPNDINQEQWLVLEITDTGCGIPTEDLRQVFEPYFTTRHEDHATGLGLTVCESIAKAHGATLDLHSEEGKGTTISMWLPLYQAPVLDIRVDHLDVEISRAATEKGPRRVLILEDEPLIRQLMSVTLKSIGCEVHQTMDGADTITKYTDAMEQGKPYQLVIMDLSIPNGMGGLQAIDGILQKDPNARAIVSSGYCDDPVLSRYMDYGFRAVLPKPYQPQELQHMVEAMLQD
jgi:CheY-like chemotaxis protein